MSLRNTSGAAPARRRSNGFWVVRAGRELTAGATGAIEALRPPPPENSYALDLFAEPD